MENIASDPSAPQPTEDARAHAEALAKLLTDIAYFARQPYDSDLSHQSIRALQFIHRAKAPPRIDEIAGLLGTAASTASELAKRLERKGLLTRQRSTTDERVVEIRLTPAGDAALANHTSSDCAKLATALARLPPAKRQGLLDAMADLSNGLQTAPSGSGT